jgi:hypothetical protein
LLPPAPDELDDTAPLLWLDIVAVPFKEALTQRTKFCIFSVTLGVAICVTDAPVSSQVCDSMCEPTH